MPSVKKRCPFCGDIFIPNPRVGDRQVACKKGGCQRERKQESQRRWLERNPGYFKGRYSNTEEWLKRYPGYLKSYRNTHPEYVERNRRLQGLRDLRRRGRRWCLLDIQDEIRGKLIDNTGKTTPLSHLDIQDEIKGQHIDIFSLLSRLPCLDIQDKIAFGGG